MSMLHGFMVVLSMLKMFLLYKILTLANFLQSLGSQQIKITNFII
jgi:hypothetical protein